MEPFVENRPPTVLANDELAEHSRGTYLVNKGYEYFLQKELDLKMCLRLCVCVVLLKQLT